MKKTFERLLSALLVLIMVLGVVPGGVFAGAKVSAAAVEGEVITYDFREFVNEAVTAAANDTGHWWNALPTGKTEDIRTLGVAGSTDGYNAMMTALKGENWTFDAAVSALTNSNYCKTLWFNGDPNAKWAFGMSNSYYHAGNLPVRARVQLELQVPAEGQYRLELNGYAEHPVMAETGSRGSGDCNIYVNGEQVAQAFAFDYEVGKALTETVADYVHLEEGTNTVMFETVTINRGFFLNEIILTELVCDCEELSHRIEEGNGTYHKEYDICTDCGKVYNEETVACTEGEENLVCGVCGGDMDCVHPAIEKITLDFKAMAVALAQEEDIWDGIPNAKGSNTKEFNTPYGGKMEEAELASYDALLTWLSDNYGWTINDSKTSMKNGYFGNTLWINADEGADWGIAFRNRAASWTEGRTQIAFDLDVEQSGWYNLDLTAVKETANGSAVSSYTGNTQPGGGYVDIIVGDEVVYEDYFFGAGDGTVTDSLVPVYLDEGTNTLIIKVVAEYSGTQGSSNKKDIALASVELIPLQYVSCQDGTHSLEAVCEKCEASWGGSVVEDCIDVNEDNRCDKCGYLLHCDHPTTEKGAKSIGKNQHQLFEVCTVEGCGQTIEGDIEDCTEGDTEGICGVCGGRIRDLNKLYINFSDLFRKASEESWWADLEDAKEDTKQAGCTGSSDPMTEDQAEAYEALKAYMLEETGWTINEELTMTTNQYVGKQIFFTTSEKAGWGLAVYPTYINHADRSKLSFDVNVEQAGWYNLTVGAYKENSTGSSAAYTGKYLGGGRADIDLNGTELYQEYSFGGANFYSADSLGMVYLEEGVNTLTFDEVKDYNGTTNNGRRCLFLKDMTLTYLGDVVVEETLSATLDLRTSYLQFDAVIDSTYAVASADEEIAAASIDADGNVLIRGVAQGSTELLLTCAGEAVCEIPVKVVPKTSMFYDFSKGSTKTSGKKGLAAIKDYDDLPDDGVVSDLWYTANVDGEAKYNTEKTTAILSGTVQFGLDVTGEGWHDILLDVYAQDGGADVTAWLAPAGEAAADEAFYLGTFSTLSEEKARRQIAVRSRRLTAGDYVLTLETEGELWLNTLKLMPSEEPELKLEIKNLADKEGRTMSSAIDALWDNGMAEDLVGARWALQYDTQGVDARIEGSTLYVTGVEPGAYEITVSATVAGVTGEATVSVTVYEASPLASADVQIRNVVTGQVARNTRQYFDFDLLGEDGEEIYFNETEVTYTASEEGIVEFIEDEAAFMGIANGETEITVSVPAVGFTKTFSVTVADVGENLLRTHDGDFEFDEPVSNANWHWQPGFGPESSQYNAKAWAFGSVHEEEDGNHCLRLDINPDGAYNISTSGTEAVLSAGHYVALEPGRMYELSVRARSENMTVPAGAAGGLMFQYQAYDFGAQARGTTLSQIYTTVVFEQNDPQWQTYKLRVMAPVEHDGTIYVMPRVILRQNNTADYNLTGFTGTAYVDDFEFREVGFDRVETVLESTPKDTVNPVNMAIHAYTTTGDIVDIAADDVTEVIEVSSSDEDVVVVEGAVERKKDLNGVYMPLVPVRLVGMNALAELETTVNIHGRELTSVLELNITGLEEVLRDVTFTADEAKAVNLKVGDVAVGDLNGRTTQLVEIDEAYIRENGNIYFKSSDTAIVTVDQSTGDMTAVGEGKATVTAYALVDGITRTDSVQISVSDDTDLVAIKLSTPVSYVGESNTMTVAVSGTKASGGPADMSNFAVAFSVDEEAAANGIATIDEDGILTGLKAGTVTVTATAGVQRSIISDSITLTVIPNEDLPSEHVIVDFTDGRTIFGENATIEADGYEINRDLTYNKGQSILHNYKGGLSCSPGVGGTVAVDVMVKKAGWYSAKATGAVFSYGGISDVFLDDAFVGVLDNKNGGNGSHYGASCKGNTLWLEPGIHTWKLTCTRSGSVFVGTLQLLADNDPNEITVNASLKPELMVGETAAVVMENTNNSIYGNTVLKAVDAEPEYSNYYYLTSSDPAVVSVSKGEITGKAEGNAQVTMTYMLTGKAPQTKVFDIMVAEGVVSFVALTAEETTLKPTDGGVQLSVVGYDTEGLKLDTLPEGLTVTYAAEENDIFTVSETGYVSITGKEGSAKVTVNVVENGRDMTAELWITVTSGKTEPTLFTYEERAIAQENAMKYNWAWREKANAVAQADYYVEHLDQVYDMLIYETFPRSTSVGFKTDPEMYTCRYCNYDLNQIKSHYGWECDPIENPWKITCPVCKNDFPSNDFGAYYESGLDEYGRFHAEDADPQYLVNELYPEKGEGWGVENGFGYDTGNVYYNGVKEVHTYIAYYMHCVFDGLGASKHSLTDALDSLRNAYLYTGDEKYGSAGAILINRVADIYPEYDTYKYAYSYSAGDGNSHKGKFIGSIWEATTMGQCLAQAADAFWPAMDNPDVIEYLRARTEQISGDPEMITPEYVRENVDNGILLEIRDAVYTGYADGNFGMEQAAMAYAAVALDRLPETEEMIDWIFRYGEKEGSGRSQIYTGGLVMYNIVNLVCRDGFGNEGSHAYNAMWYTNLMEVADALNGYTRVEGADLWANPKFVNMVGGMMKLTTMGCVIPSWGEAGYIQFPKSGMDVESMLAGFIATGNRDLAVAIYAANGNTTDGLHGTIFTKDPESGIKSRIERIVAEDGVFNFSESNMLCGLGMAFLREGPAQYLGAKNADQFSDYWMFFGRSTGGAHTNLDILNIDIDAFGLNLSSDLGYPTTVNAQSPERMQFTLNTSSHNTVVVNDKAQLGCEPNQFPMHFEDAGKAKVVDADASRVYEETDIYRRTLVVMDNGDGVNYAVDFFRVLGGEEHVYSFHAATMKDPVTEGLEFTYQPMGTYAGADVPFGDHTVNSGTTDAAANQGSGYSWLKEVNRDGDPDTYFSLDWPIQDFHNRLTTSAGIHLKLHMVSEEPVTEVATAHGQPPQNVNNPDFIEYTMIRRSGDAGMDTLFTSVIEPYQHASYIAAVELVDAVLVEGTEAATDKAAVLKITLENGREDYVVYATNPDCTYSICEDGEEVFKFRGFAGVCSYESGEMTYAWGNEVTTIEDAEIGAVIDGALPAATGTVTDFTKGLADEYSMTIALDQQVSAEDLAGRYIYVNNDRQQNGAYRIYGAEVNGNVAVLDLHTQDMVRSYVDPTNLDMGYIHNIEAGQTFSIPLSATFDVGALFNYTTDKVIKTGNKTVLTTGVAGSGYTYEIEGLPTAAKVNAKDGTITWTPSRTQTGRYPVTVYALQDGEAMAEMSFVIYVVNYTGSTYDAAICGHTKAVTFEADGFIETVCPACGSITRVSVDAKFDLAGANMTLGNELKLNFMVNNSDLKAGYYAVITHGDTEVEQTFSKYNSTYSMVTCSVAAKQMADEISVQVFDADGNAVSNVYESSVKDYAMRMLERDMSDKINTLLVDMLNYGAQAQSFFGYNEEDLANDLLTEEQQALATGEVECEDRREQGENYYGSNLSLEDRILLNLYFRDCTEEMYARISYTDYTGQARVADGAVELYSGNLYKVVVDEIVLADAFCDVTVTVYNPDGTVHGSAADSVESYIARNTGSAINDAIIKFAYSAREYFA